MEIERITLTGTELKTLEIQHRALHDKKAADKVKTIILLSKGWTYPQIEEALLLDQRTLARYKEIYLRDGLDSLISVKYHGGMAKLSDDQISNLQKYLDETLCSTATEVCEYVKKKFHIEYKPHSMVKLLGRIGFSYKKKRRHCQEKPIPRIRRSLSESTMSFETHYLIMIKSFSAIRYIQPTT